MARGVNKVILVGNLGADPEVRYLPNGTAATTIRLATSEQWKDKQSGQAQERTEWHRVKFFGKLAEIAGEYLKKGRQVYVEGKLRTDKYTDREGVERYTTDIIADEMQMLGQNTGSDSQRASSESSGASARDYAERRSTPAAPPASRDSGGSVDDDDIPFAPPFTRRNWGALS